MSVWTAENPWGGWGTYTAKGRRESGCLGFAAHSTHTRGKDRPLTFPVCPVVEPGLQQDPVDNGILDRNLLAVVCVTREKEKGGERMML